MAITPHEWPGRDKRAIAAMVPALLALGLLTDTENAEVSALLSRADLAAYTANSAAELTLAAANATGARLATDSKIDSDRILKSANALPSQNGVDAVCTAIYENCVNAAREIAFANASQIAATLNKEYNSIVEEFQNLDLGGIRTDREAIDAGKVDQFRRFHELQDRYADLRSIQDLAFRNYAVATPRLSGEYGDHWRYRLAKDPLQKLGADDLGKFAEEMRRQPYCPLSRDEALNTKSSWESA